MTAQEKKELLRTQVLMQLAGCHPISFTAGQLQLLVANKMGASPDELASALALLESDKLIESKCHALGATKSYTATGEGVKAMERGL
ncbi:MAG: hypothetical protein NTY01_09295 [Verrucomicrobia bacterium]|nr:hypothetical protein [Verrucomicrobiota bacterium]